MLARQLLPLALIMPLAFPTQAQELPATGIVLSPISATERIALDFEIANDEALAVLGRLPSTDPADLAEVEALLEGLPDGDPRAITAFRFLSSLAVSNVDPEAEDLFEDDNVTNTADAFEERAHILNLAVQFQALSIFNAAPGFSNARLTFDEPEDPRIVDAESALNSIKLPITRNFNEAQFCVGKGNPASRFGVCATPYAEITLGYLRNRTRGNFGLAVNDVGIADDALPVELTEDLLFQLPPEAFIPIATGESPAAVVFNSPVRSTTETFSALAGVGVTVPVTRDIAVRPIFLGGYSYITDDTDFSGAFADFNEAISDNAGLNVDLNSALFGGGLEILYDHVFGDSLDLRSRLRYNHLFSHIFEASDDVLEQTNQFSVLTANLEAAVPTGYRFYGSAVDLIGTTGLFYLKEGAFVEKSSAVSTRLDSNLLAQVGGGLQIRNNIVEAAGLRGSYVFGDGVEGWKVGLNVKF